MVEKVVAVALGAGVVLGMAGGGVAMEAGVVNVEQERVDAAALAKAIEAHLREQILNPVYPRARDARGGYFQEYDREWKKGPDNVRTMVYQARLAWTAGRVAAERADLREKYVPHAKHGLTYLQTVLWDGEKGGFWWGVDSKTRVPNETTGDRKMMYGQAFGVYAAAGVYAGTKEEGALDLAKKGYRWMEQYGRDKVNGGYFEVLNKDGSRKGTPGDKTADVGGWPLGLKTSNTALHVLEAYAELYAVWPDEGLKKDLTAMVEVFRDKIIQPSGHMAADFQDDWTVASPHVSWGHDVEAAHLLLYSADLVGMQGDEKLVAQCRRLVDLALEKGWDEKRGGLYENKPGLNIGDPGPKDWWPQAEMLLALAVMHERYGGETDKYWKAMLKQWECIEKQFTDTQFPGRIGSVDATGKADYRKLHEWKETYHDTRCLLYAADTLNRIAAKGSKK